MSTSELAVVNLIAVVIESNGFHNLCTEFCSVCRLRHFVLDSTSTAGRMCSFINHSSK